MEKITGEVKAVSEKEIDTKKGPMLKTGVKINDTWVNKFGKVEIEKGDYVEAICDKNDYGYQIKTIKKIEKPAEAVKASIKADDKTAERIARSVALDKALKTFELNNIKQFTEMDVIRSAAIYEKYVIGGVEIHHPTEVVVKEELVE